MRRPNILILLAASAAMLTAAAPAPSVGRASLAGDAETRWVPFDLTPGNQIRFTIAVDGRPLTAILDTGVSYSVLARRVADPAKVRALPGEVATAIGGAVDIGWTDTASVAIGALTRQGAGVTVAALPAAATGSVKPVDVLIGRDMLGDHALDIDFTQRRFRLLPSGRMPFQGQSAPLAISPQRQVYVSELALGAQRLRPVIVDTGDGSSVTVTDAGWAAAKLPAIPTTTAISYGLAGAVTSTIGIVPTLAVGQLSARNVEVRVEPTGGFSETVGVAGRIGNGFLQNYRVLLDPAAGRMVLSPGAGADWPPLRSTSGLLLGLDHHRLRVLHVMKGGPAEATGWHTGELICSIDGAAVPADYGESPLAAWSAGTPGRVVNLGLCDGTARRLTLRHFY